MIPRYSRPEMARLWSEENKFATWLRVEIAATEVLAERGIVPGEALAAIRERARFDLARIDAIEREVQHDVIAFVSSVAENVGPEGRWIHYGVTASAWNARGRRSRWASSPAPWARSRTCLRTWRRTSAGAWASRPPPSPPRSCSATAMPRS